jgi:hypothetical protein
MDKANRGAKIREEQDMKFMLMMNAPRGDGNWGVVNWARRTKAMVNS